MTMLCTLIRGQMSYTFFQFMGHMSSFVNYLGGRCPLMPFFIGDTCPGGGMSYTHQLINGASRCQKLQHPAEFI